jgi:SAM-dependent methyltransferase
MGTTNDNIPILLKRIQNSWEAMAKDDAMWAILTNNNKWDVDNFFATGQVFIKTTMDYFKSLKININYGDCLDFGCGIGRLTQPLAEWFERVVGVDISNEMILQAHKFNKYPTRLRYLQNTENLPFADHSFDYVQSHIVLQHIDYALSMRYLEEFARVLRPGGILYFQLPVSLGESTGPQEIILDKLNSLGAHCLHAKLDVCPDGMKSCMYIACR